MATQSGVIRMKGRVGELSFFRSKKGYRVRKSEGIEGKRIKTDPSFERTRENNAEFARAGKSAKLMRNALRSFIKKKADNESSQRLVQLMTQIVRSDTTHGRGERVVLAQNLEPLRGFEFNAVAPLSETLFVEQSLTIDRQSGALTLDLPALAPSDDLMFAPGSTHARLVVIALEIDFDNGRYVTQSAKSELIPDTVEQIPPTSLMASFTPNSNLPVIALVGVQFVQVIENIEYPLKSGASNALAVVEVDNV